MRALAGIAVTALLLSGCSMSIGQRAPERSEEPIGPCLQVPMETLQAIAQGADGTELIPRAGVAARSADFDELYMIAMRFGRDDDGAADRVGVWASGSLQADSGAIVAVDEVAQELTVWPDVLDGTALDATLDGVDDAKGCL